MCKFISKKIHAAKNVPNWVANENDYQLVFCECIDGLWHECGHNIAKYADMTLADYLSEMCLSIPDYTQFMRVCAPEYQLEYRAYGGRVRIDYIKNVD